MNKCYILQGISGSGKSTFIEARFPDSLVYSADHFFTRDGEYLFDQAKLKDAHAWCFRRFMAACRNGDNPIVVDNTNTSVWEIAPYYRVAEVLGYEATILRLVCSPTVAFARNAHAVPLDVINHQHNRMIDQTPHLPPWWNLDKVDTNGQQ